MGKYCIREWIGRIKFRNKILLCFILLAIIVFIIASVSSYSLLYRLENKELADLAELSATQTMKNLDMYLDELNRLTTMSLSDESLRSAIRGSSGNNRQTTESTSAIFQFLSNVYLYRNDFHSVAIYTSDDKCFIQTSTTYVAESETDADSQDIITLLNNSTDIYQVVGLRQYQLPIGPKKSNEVFTVVRRLLDIRGNTLGIFVLNTYSDTLKNIISNDSKDNETQIYLLDENKCVICHTQTDGHDAMNEDGKFNTDDYVVASVTGSQTKWTITVATPVAKLASTVLDRMMPTMILLAICLVLTIALYALFAYAFTQPLKRLSDGMKKVGKGDFKVVVEPTAMDEIGELTVRFNKMTAHIDHLLDRMVEMEVKEKESEYLILQSQVNPHFLYNTLEAIRMRCIVDKEKDIANVINSLSNLFRLSISRRERFVALRDELEHVRCYVAVQNFRFDNKYHLTINADESLLDYRTFKLMLQPLVENCVFHGLEVKPDEGHITIDVNLEGKYLIVRVSDDGVGIPEDKLLELREYLEHPSEQTDKQSLGMRTVHERIRLFFGNECGLTVQSEENKGTCITLCMLAFTNENEVNFHA